MINVLVEEGLLHQHVDHGIDDTCREKEEQMDVSPRGSVPFLFLFSALWEVATRHPW